MRIDDNPFLIDADDNQVSQPHNADMPVIPVLKTRNASTEQHDNASNEHDNTGMQDNTVKPVNDKHDAVNARMNLNHTGSNQHNQAHDEMNAIDSNVNNHHSMIVQPNDNSSSGVSTFTDYADMESLDAGKQHGCGWIMRRVIANIMIIVFIIAGCYASYKIGRFREGLYRDANPIVKTITKTIVKPTAMDDEHMQAFASIMMNRHGLDATHTAAIIGVVYGESKGNPTALERTDRTDPDDCKVDEHGASENCPNDAVRAWVQTGAHGIGLLQWTGSRAIAYLDYADGKQEKWDDLNTQVDYLMLEIDDVNSWREPLDFTGNVGANGQAGLDAFNADRDVRMASWHFLAGFVRPANPTESYPARLKACLDAYRWMQLKTANVNDDK